MLTTHFFLDPASSIWAGGQNVKISQIFWDFEILPADVLKVVSTGKTIALYHWQGPSIKAVSIAAIKGADDR